MATYGVTSGLGQNLTEELQTKVDAIVVAAYQSANAEFPCRLKTRGKPKMLRWQEVDRCLNQADDRVDWEALSQQLQDLRNSVYGLTESDFSQALELSLSAHAITYSQVFSVSDNDLNALLPLTNSLLKYLPDDSLMHLPVFVKEGDRIGTFSGKYFFERGGGLATAINYRLAFFQYTDSNGEIRSVSDNLLLDSFGVSWKGAINQRGFRLPSDKLLP